MIAAFVHIKAEPSRITALATELADVPGIAEVYSVAGDVDLIAIVRVRHHDELADVVTNHIATKDGILETRSMVAFRAYSTHDLESVFSLGID